VRILANENVPQPVVASLRTRGHDVAWVAEIRPGMEDREVLALAQQELRVVVTFDKDFGELAFAAGLPASCGVVLFRLQGASPEVDNQRAVTALSGRDDWSGVFAIIEDDRVRVRAIGKPGGPRHPEG
jgi:predicted nuclease of predicted toxin-antitoxin system